LLASGTFKRYIDEFSITGLTSNPTIFDHAIARSYSYDEAMAGVDVDELAAILQREGAASFSASWNNLMNSIAAKSAALGQSGKRA